jgi:hypothetical protein
MSTIAPSKTREVLRLTGRLALLAAPIWMALGWFLVADPFKVVRSYDSYYVSGEPIYVNLNRGFVSTATFLNHYPSPPYEAFIFGNSRSLFYEVRDWQQFIGDTPCFHFDASDESLYGIERKLAFLDQRGVALRHALLVMDSELLAQAQENPGYLFRAPPQISGTSSISFQWAFLRTFLDANFIKSYLKFKLTGEGFSNTPFDYELTANELRLAEYETELARDPDAFYAARQNLFFGRTPEEEVSSSVIGPKQERLLASIAAIFRRQKTDFHAVISPLYDQDKLNPADRAKLETAFGPGRVFDYSGVNDLTQSVTNYYETSHYRPHVARRILSEIYATRDSAPASPGSPP